jgi:hypothetical protein
VAGLLRFEDSDDTRAHRIESHRRCRARNSGILAGGFPPVLHRTGLEPCAGAGAGAVLAPGNRTVTQALRVMGLADQPGFGRYYEALNRAQWASEHASEGSRDVARRLLLGHGD